MNLIEKMHHSICFFKSSLKHLDLILSFLIFSAGFLIILLSFFLGIGQYGMGFAFIFSSLIYYYFKIRTEIICPTLSLNYFNINSGNSFLITNIVYFVCFAASNFILWNSVYYRSTSYFLIITIAYFSIFIEILNHKNSQAISYLIIFKTILLSLFLRIGRFYSFPTIPGSDTHYHLLFVKSIIKDGTIYGFENASKYFYTPLWHVFEAMSGIILDLPLKDALFFSIVLMFAVISSLFIYIICRKIFNDEVGLLAVLIINIADMLFVRGVTNINTSSFVHIFLIMTLLCLITNKNRVIYSFFVLLFILCSVLTHQLSTFLYFIVLSSLLLGNYIYSFNSVTASSNLKIHLKKNTVQYFFIVMIFYWSTMGPASGYTFFDNMVSRLYSTFSSIFNEYTSHGGPNDTVYSTLFSQFDFISNLFFNLGYSLLVFMSIFGVLVLLNRKYSSNVTFSFIISSMVLFTIIYPGTYLGLDQVLIPHRFISLLEIFLIIFASYSIYFVYRIVSIHKFQRIGLLLLTICLIFFMVTTPYINRNDAIYCSDRGYRTGYTVSELKSIEWANQCSEGILSVDPLIYSRPISTVDNFNLSSIQLTSYPSDLNADARFYNILLRQYIVDNPHLYLGGTFGKTKTRNFEKITIDLKNRFNCIYSVGSSSIYKQ